MRERSRDELRHAMFQEEPIAAQHSCYAKPALLNALRSNAKPCGATQEHVRNAAHGRECERHERQRCCRAIRETTHAGITYDTQ